MLRSGCGCLVACALCAVALIVGLIEMTSQPSLPAHQPTPTTVHRGSALHLPAHPRLAIPNFGPDLCPPRLQQRAGRLFA